MSIWNLYWKYVKEELCSVSGLLLLLHDSALKGRFCCKNPICGQNQVGKKNSGWFFYNVLWRVNSYQSTGSDIGIANHTTSIAFFTKSSNGDTGLFSAKNQIWMMFSHFFFLAILSRMNLDDLWRQKNVFHEIFSRFQCFSLFFQYVNKCRLRAIDRKKNSY